MACVIWRASGRSEPCRGRSLTIVYLPLPNVLQVFGRPELRLAEAVPATLDAVVMAATIATSANATVNFFIILNVPPVGWLTRQPRSHSV